MSDDGTTIGVWVGPDDQRLVDRFDDAHNDGSGTYSRSKAIKEAMRLAVQVEAALDDAGLDLDGRGRAAFLRQAILDVARDQRTSDE